MELVVLSSDSNTCNGCDRVILADNRVVVQGVTVLRHPDFTSVSVPEGETLTAISARIFLEAARELERRISGRRLMRCCTGFAMACSACSTSAENHCPCKSHLTDHRVRRTGINSGLNPAHARWPRLTGTRLTRRSTRESA